METVVVIFGGRSAEHDVSIITAIASIIKPLELTRKYQVEAVYIAKDGSWYWDEKLKDISLFTSGAIKDFVDKSTAVSVRFDGGMTLLKTTGIAGHKQRRRIDIAFPAMHGTYGEDGALMGLLDMAGIPYVGCDQAASVIAMDKVLAKQMAQAHAVPVTAFEYFSREDVQRDLFSVIQQCTSKLAFPMFVKPAHLGSSIGITRVASDIELQNGLEVAAHYDDKIIVEEAVQNLLEVTLPVIGNGHPRPALLEQPMTDSEDFFDFETKYMQGGQKGKKGADSKGAHGYSKLPAELPRTLYRKAEQTGLAVYKAIGCSGTARVDMLIDSKAGKVYFNEVNPLPGSLYLHNWKQAGVSSVDFVQTLILLAKERHAERMSLSTSFTTNYLQQF